MALAVERQPRKHPVEGIVVESIPAPYKVSNQELARYLNSQGTRTSSDKEITAVKIEEATGILNRSFLQPLGESPKPIEETVPELAYNAAKIALRRKAWSPQDIDILAIVSSYPVESLARNIKSSLGARNCDAIPVYAACSGYIHLLSWLKFKYGNSETRVLAVIPEHYSSKMHDADINRTIFRDGVEISAMTVGSGEKCDIQIIDSAFELQKHSAIRMPVDYAKIDEDSLWIPVPNQVDYFEMNGKQVVEQLRGSIFKSMFADVCLSRNGSGIKYVIPHQGSKKILGVVKEMSQELGLNVPVTDKTLANGNAAAGSTPGELAAVLRSEPIHKGDEFALTSVGAGLAFGVTRIKMLKPPAYPSPN